MTPARPDPPLSAPPWLLEECERLITFAAASVHPHGGFAWLDSRGAPQLDRPVESWITCRMTHTFALAAIRGDERSRKLAKHGVDALCGRLRDPEHGGWFAASSDEGPTTTDKRAYDHAFVVLAAASACAAGLPRAHALLRDALDIVQRYFWDNTAGMVVDVWDRSWTELEPYRGVNANMHMVEAFLAASEVSGDQVWLTRAAQIAERVVNRVAREHNWRIPEHFDPEWRVQRDYNRDHPADQFRPYGVIVGHLFEWSRLLLHLGHALRSDCPQWMPDAARALYARGLHGWNADGADGFVYTTDFTGRPVVRHRLHWVVTEAIAAAWTLHVATGEASYAAHHLEWCEYARTYHVDMEHGSWHHELDTENRPASNVWSGKPDIYHAYQAALLPKLGPMGSFAGALIRAR